MRQAGHAPGGVWAPNTSPSALKRARAEGQFPAAAVPPAPPPGGVQGGPTPHPGAHRHCSGATGAPEQWKCTFCHLPSRRCHTRVSSDWLVRGRPCPSMYCVRRM